ncbi:MAG: SusC/RagA family TonB-linked outer membrane protein [Bacteroidetes bacterium]|nr:SusC/RagA family TonB-linked outer membrane protein [Bacteroidota bacterium]
MERKLLILLVLLVGFGSLNAQSIRGTVTDPKQEAVIGATVKVEGTPFGAVTDALGNYEIKNLKSGNYKLRFSSVGYTAVVREVSVGTSTITLNVVMKEDTRQMDELVVVGYGVQRKREITGSVAKIGGKELNDLPVPSFEAAMQGKAAGVQVTVGSGLAGAASIIRIRGISSISASGDPLYVVDGIPITQDYFMLGNSGGMNNNPLATINPDDIESVEILKDAAANAIYGSRGANGVILITTKRAQKPGWKLSASTRIGVSLPTARPRMLNSSEWLQLNQEAWENDGNSGRAPLPGGMTYANALLNNTDWVDQTIHTGFKHAYNFSASKGGEKLSSQITLSHEDNGTYLKGNSFVRTTGRLNMDYNATKWLKIGLNSSLSSGVNNRVNAAWSGGLGAAMSTALPIYPVYNSDGTWFRGGSNPVRDMNNLKWRTQELRSLNGIYLTITPIKNLVLRGQASYDYMNLDDDQWRSPEITGQANAGDAYRGMAFNKNFNYYATATYLGKLNEDHSFQVMVGNEFQRANSLRRRTFASNVPDLYHNEPTFLLTSPVYIDNGTNWAFLSYFGRANYDYKKKFNLQAVYRIDASSRFGTNYRWATFPSLSAGWILSEEKFLKNNPTISFLKIRSGWGKSGNAGIPDDARFATYSAASNNINYNGNGTVFPNKLQNPNLRWETSDNIDAAVELGIFKDRLTFELGYYERITKDVLMQLTIPNSIGFGDNWENVGKIRNRGVEFSFKSRNVMTKDFQWTTNFNVARNDNKILSIGVYTEDAVSGGTNDTRVVVNHPVGTNYLIRWSHVDAATGRPVYLDINGNQTFVYNNSNRVPAGKILPDAIGGLTNTFRYKNWDMSVLIIFSIGSNIYESSQKRQSTLITDWNMDERVYDRWRTPGDVAKYPRLTKSYTTYGLPDEWSNTTLWLKDGSYARLRNVTLGYNLPNAVCKKMNITSLRIAAIAANIFTITKYDGLDPELGRDAEGGGQGALNNARNMGAQNITYLTPPQEKSYSLQVNIEF